MHKRIVTIFLIGVFQNLTPSRDLFAESAMKQASSSKDTLMAGLHIAQISFSNWAAGGNNMLSYVLSLDTRVEKKFHKYGWTIGGAFAFGQTKISGEALRNATDKIEMDGTCGYRAGIFVNPYASVSLNTRFTTGYDYAQKPKMAKSDFWDPIYLMQSCGGGISIGKIFKTRLGVALKETFTQEHRQYSDDPKTPEQEWAKWETGIESRSDLSASLAKEMTYVSKLELFSAFEHIDIADVKWEHLVTAKFAKYVTMKLELQIYYDRDVTAKTQVKQALTVGLTYPFM